MAIYTGVNGAASKIKKAYVGINGIARRVKKAYVGINGIPRLAYSKSEGVLEKVESVTALSVARNYLVATTVGGYALFGGGRGGSSVVDAYDSSLVRSTPTVLSQARSELAATNVGDYALFGGGYSAVVDAYKAA